MSDRKNMIAAWAQRCAFVLCIASWLVICGCVALGIGAVGVVAGGGAIVFVKGNLTQTLYSPEMQVHDATVKALNDLKLPIVLDKSDAMVAKMESEFADGKRLWIELKSVNPQSTDVCIRVGFWGDEQPAREVLQKIQSHL